MHILVDNAPHDVEAGIQAISVARDLGLTGPDEAIGLLVNGEPRDLSVILNEGDKIEFIDFADPRGSYIFWHTSAHVLAQAVMRLWPKAKPTIGPPIKEGFYYDFADLEIGEEDMAKIEKECKKILKENFKTERKVLNSKAEAIEAFGENAFKKELIESFEEGSELSAYTQGEFCDLCRGPHLYSLSKIKAFKILKTSGAYWRGDCERESLTRIYGISFPKKEQLADYLFRLEEAKKRDHRLLGQKLGLFAFKPEAPGIPFIYPHGMIVWEKLVGFWRELHKENGYVEIKTPSMMTRGLWELSGHWDHYQEHMYTTEVEDHLFAIKPMNCPGCMLYYKANQYSYRDFPLRVSEIGHVHRHEFSGALSGLFRVRSFHQDDAHVFMTPEQIKDEILSIFAITDRLYGAFGLKYRVELSTRPEEGSIGTDADWEKTTASLSQALDESGIPYKINPGDGAFYGPKIDFHILDALGRSWQCGTIQLDMSLPERFDLDYTTTKGTKERPIMIHRALFGSIERFFGILIEHYAGKFPLWLSPRGVYILPVAERHISYSEKLQKELSKAGIDADIDKSQETMAKKVRLAQIAQANYMLTIGDKECENGTLSIRTRSGSIHECKNVQSFIETLQTEMSEKSSKSAFVKEESTLSAENGDAH